MILIELAALMASGTVGAAQPAAMPPPALQPAPDTAERRRQLRDFSMCLARQRTAWARNALAQPYLSSNQAGIAAQSLSGRDTCMPGQDVEVTFRTSTMVGSLAEHFLAEELPRADFTRVARTLMTQEPRNASEDFALCVAARGPAAARNLALSEPGSAAEQAAAEQLAAFIAPCTAPGEQATADLQSLRALMSVALYRGLTTTLAARN